jgi:6-phosphogluconate dehydrogenase (decarboxylating)
VDAAKKLKVDVRVIEAALKVRKESEKKGNQKLLRNKLLALMRNRFGGHEVMRSK